MIVELHLLQNVAPSCLNRDDANAPKDCDFGGYRRSRISSQCIKKSIRDDFRKNLPLKTGFRSKLATQQLFEKLKKEIDAISDEKALNLSELICKNYFSNIDKNGVLDVLVFFDEAELDGLVSVVKENYSDKMDIPKTLKLVKTFPLSYDIALFGRMLANFPGNNIDGACQVAHAISTNKASMEFDFYTAIDDLQAAGEQGAGMMGTISFTSSCFYRYSVIHLSRLQDNLKNDKEAVKDCVNAYIKSSFTAMPTGKQNSFAAHNPPSFAYCVVRDTNTPWSLANAFEKPIKPDNKNGLVSNSVSAIVKYWESLSTIYGSINNVVEGSLLCLQNDEITDKDLGSLIEYKKNNIDEFILTITDRIQ